MKQLKLGLETQATKIWTSPFGGLKKARQTEAEFLQELKEVGIQFDGQLIVKRALEARGVKYNPKEHERLDLEWGVHFA